MDVRLPVHFFAQFEPPPDSAEDFRSELLRVVRSPRAAPGCCSIRVFESLRHQPAFAIDSEWEDEAAFKLHTRLPHTLRFLAAAERLLDHPVQGMRTREIIEAPNQTH